MAYRYKCSFAFISALFLHLVSTQSFNPTILQDSRDLPQVDGTFGFLYRTEDGIAHAAKGDSNGVIHGRFSYTDPTGLKVNYNYNAGSQVAPGYTEEPAAPRRYQQPQAPQRQYQQPQAQAPQRQHQQPRREEYREPPQYDYDDSPQYVDPQPEYVPHTRPSSRRSQRGQQSRPQYSAQYREPVEALPQRRARPVTQNEVYEDYRN